MRIPSRQLMILRSVVTLQLSAVIGQAGWAAAALGRGGPLPLVRSEGVLTEGGPRADGGEIGGFLLDQGYLHLHSVFAGVTLLVTVVSAVLYVALRRNAGPVNLWLALASLVAVAAQYALGEARLADIHVFLGVLIAMLVTALTSWTYRHDDGEPPAFPRVSVRVE